MSALSIWGVLLLVAAGGGFYFMRQARSQLHAMIGAETLPVPQLETLRKASDEVGGHGGFRKGCEVVGSAHPRPKGLLTSELSKTECVWYRYVIKRKFKETRYDGQGRRRTRRRTETVAEHVSAAGYAVQDGQGALIGVDPNGAETDQPEQVVKRFEPYEKQGPNVFGVQLPDLFDTNNTIGHQYEEWIIRPGQQLYVLGEVHDKIGPLVVGKPESDGYFIISTRSEQELRAVRRKRHMWLAIGVIAGAVLGAGLLVVGILAALTG